LGIGLLVLKYIFQPELRAYLPEVIALWYTILDVVTGEKRAESERMR